MNASSVVAGSENGTQNGTQAVPHYPYGIVPLDSPELIIATCFCTSFFFASFLGAFWVVLNRDSRVVQQSQPATLFLSFFSLALLNGTILLGLGRPMTVGLCVGRLWGVQLALLLFLASQVIKGWTLFRFAQTSRARPIKVSEEKTLAGSFVFLLVFAAIMVLWTVLEPVGPTPDYAGCISSGKAGEISALTCLSILWAIWFFFASQTYDLKARLTEYNLWVCLSAGMAGIVAIIATHADRSVFTPPVQFVAEAACAAFVTLVVLLCGIIPKLTFTDEDLEVEEIEEELEKRVEEVLANRRRGTSASTARTLSLTPYQADAINSVLQTPEDEDAIMTRHGSRKTIVHSHRRSSGSRRRLSKLRSRGSNSSIGAAGSHHPHRRHTYHARSTGNTGEAPTLTRVPRSRSTNAMTVYNPPATFTEEGVWL